MGTSREGIKRIIELWALGLSAKETVETMRQEKFKIAVATVYRQRHSLTAHEMIDELTRRQLRDIAQADPGLKLKYRDKLLAKMMPQQIEQKVDATVQMQGLAFEHDSEIRELLRKAAEVQKAEKDADKT